MATPVSYATPYTELIKAARYQIVAARGSNSAYTTDKFWSDDELFQIAKRGTTDLWASIIDLHQDHFLKINSDDVSLESGDSQLSGVPIDTFRVSSIESSDPTTTSCVFVPRDYNSAEFRAARYYNATNALTPTSGLVVFYCLTGVGTPNNTPIIRTAPTLSAAVSVNFAYVPVLGVQNYDLNSTTNPIPGESDQALIAWIIAYMRGKEREDRSPDPAWLTVYSTEKNSLLARLTPRQEDEPQYVESVFG